MKTLILCLAAIFYFVSPGATSEPALRIVLVGDASCAQKRDDLRPQTGWGEKLGAFFKDNVTIVNLGANGCSTKSYRTEGRWRKAIEQIGQGDIVFIQFGHSDEQKNNPKRYTPLDDYAKNLTQYVEEIRQKGATPVILTPFVRRKFDAEGNLVDTHGRYPQAARNVASKMDVPLLDMQKASAKFVGNYGVEESKELYMWVSKADYPHLSKDQKDNVHTCELGAEKFAELIVKEIKKEKIKPLVSFLK